MVSNKKDSNPNFCVVQFKTRWDASGYATMYGDAIKKWQFVANLKKGAKQWFSQYRLAPIKDYISLKEAFLGKFNREETPIDIFKKLEAIKKRTW